MILTRENRITARIACCTATFFTSLRWTDLKSNRGLHGYRPSSNHLSHDKVI